MRRIHFTFGLVCPNFQSSTAAHTAAQRESKENDTRTCDTTLGPSSSIITSMDSGGSGAVHGIDLMVKLEYLDQKSRRLALHQTGTLLLQLLRHQTIQANGIR